VFILRNYILHTFAVIFALFFVLWYVEVEVEPELASGQNVNPDASLFNCDSYDGKFYTLNESLDCDSENGIAINTNNTVINLNNFSILGSGYLNPYTGILISNKENVTLTGNGIVGHFQIGVYINNSKNVDISIVNFTGNEISVYVANSSGILIANNQFYTNTAGIKFYTIGDSVISNNTFDSNDISSISLFGSHDNIINDNLISSSLNGIFVDTKSTNTSLNSNHFTRSFGVDINIGNGGKFNEIANSISNNTCSISIPETLCR
jgi:parallel beta-helix repeat protein